MTGTSDYKALRATLFGCLVSTLGLSMAAADKVILNDGVSGLSGELRSIEPSGTLLLATGMSDAPLQIKGDSVKKITLANPEKSKDMPPTLVMLINGDIIRGNIEGIDEQALTLKTKEAGNIKINRDNITSVQFGLQRNTLIYSGPNNLTEWKQSNSTRDRWVYHKDSLVSMGRATASKDLNLPQQFALSFTLKWKSERPPQYEIFFADPLGNAKKRPDRYSFTFNNYGIEICRYSKNGGKSQPIGQLNRKPKQFSNNEMQVEIRVNRDTARLQLFINGEPEGDFADPIENIPDGTGIQIVSESFRGSELEISGIRVTEYSDSTLRHSSEGHGDNEHDSLIMRDDERWSGKLINISTSENDSILRFQSPTREESLEVPTSEVSMIYLTHESIGKEAPNTTSTRAVALANQWQVKLTDCVMDGEALSAKHSLIGAMKIGREHIISIDQLETPKPSTKQDQP